MVSKELETRNLLEEIFKKYGYDFRDYSKASFNRRLSRVLINNNISGIEELQETLLSNNSFFSYFVEEITVNVTEMFRDPSFYVLLRKKIIPTLSTYPFIRIWDAGCSTGEELFSLAILLQEENLLERTKIYATDINQKVLLEAKEGIFPISRIADYTRNYQMAGGKKAFSDYYKARYEGALFDKLLIKNVVFYPHNLATDGSFNEFHLIICRNVLIYFNRELQEKVLKLFLNSLIPLGFLGLGRKEDIIHTGLYAKFEVFDREEKIFKKINF